MLPTGIHSLTYSDEARVLRTARSRVWLALLAVALVAYPAEYGNSGVMTFMVNHSGIVLQKDLGPNTARIASRMTAFDPDQTWRRVDPADLAIK